MDDSHSYRENLDVSLEDFSLTISNLRLSGPCAGQYICRSTVDEDTVEQSYNLVVTGTVNIENLYFTRMNISDSKTNGK